MFSSIFSDCGEIAFYLATKTPYLFPLQQQEGDIGLKRSNFKH